jgi:hypothetical protein
LNAAELNALVKQDLERESARLGHATGKPEQKALAADIGKEAIEQSRRQVQRLDEAAISIARSAF